MQQINWAEGFQLALVYPQVITGADLLHGIIKLDQLAPLLKRRGAVAVGIVNSKMYGVRSFCKVMEKYGIKPVIGLSIELLIDDDRTVLLYAYAKDDIGYSNLLKISSASSTRETETLPLKWLKAYSAGCIFICPMTDDSYEGLRNVDLIRLLTNSCGEESLYIGVGRPGGIRHHEEYAIVEMAEAAHLTITAIQESRYLHKEDEFAFEVASAIRLGYKLNDPSKPQTRKENAYVPAEEELKDWFSDRPEWLSNMSEMLLSCNGGLPPAQFILPKFPVAEGMTAEKLLKSNCQAGLKRRIPFIDERYEKRLEKEIGIICEMGFADYFLIVEDFIRFAREQGILTGPGRGSSAGSLVAYALHITDVDPIRYNLIFERFLNPGRITMPDIDVDFADHRRSEVIEYVARKYGKGHVAQIITFGTLSTKSVARNVARVFDFTNEEMAFVSNAIREEHARSLEEAVNKSKPLQQWIAIDPIREKWLHAAKALEGLPRNASTHAAGVVLSPTPLVNTVPLQNGGEDIYLTQWAMGDVEESGLLKMDFLGLRNLTLMDRIKSMIEHDKGGTFRYDNIPLNDDKTLELFRAGDTTGIFQFESAGMRDALRLIKPDKFEDVYAATALYRPGPMENIPLYSKRKNAHERFTYLHPELEPILKETEGIIVYQEQIMQIAVRIAGFSLSEADLLRRAVSKKKREILHEERIHFVQSAVRRNFPEKVAADIYDLIVKFADYGFPKSHAVAYSYISYQLAYVKANEPAYFYAALLSTAAGNQEKMMEMIREAKEKGIQILPPSVNKSKYMHIVENGHIRLGLGAIKGITPTFYNVLKEARRISKPWTSLFDFAVAIGGDHFTEKNIIPLVKAGALDEFGESRAVLLASIDAARNHALFVRPEGDDLLHEVIYSVANPKYSPGGTMKRLTLLENEREVLGFYLSEHPAVEMKRRMQERYLALSEVDKMNDRTFVKVVGLLIDIKRIRTKKGEAMAFVTLQDETGEKSCTIFPKQYAANNVHLQELNLVMIEGTVERRRGQPQIVVQSVKEV